MENPIARIPPGQRVEVNFRETDLWYPADYVDDSNEQPGSHVTPSEEGAISG